jgi:Ca2+-binding EF-hand superfamily protein
MTEQVEEASPTFATLDANYDGAISAEEAQKYSDLVSVFDEADANDDGQLSAAEYDNAVSTLLAS